VWSSSITYDGVFEYTGTFATNLSQIKALSLEHEQVLEKMGATGALSIFPGNRFRSFYHYVINKRFDNYISIYNKEIRDNLIENIWKEDKSGVMNVETFILWLFENKIEVPSIASLSRYLLAHQDLLDDVIIPALNSAIKTFDNITMLINQESDDEYALVLVRHREYTDEILDQIDLIQEDYSKKLRGKSGWFLLTTDFGEPR
jgi:hypothetical protein